jgi:predicted nucleic acid-binding protein
MTVFVDTFAIFAWLNRRDMAHILNNEYMRSYLGNFVTTEWVLLEVANALCSANHRRSAIEMISDITKILNSLS